MKNLLLKKCKFSSRLTARACYKYNDEKFLSDGGYSGSKKCTQGRVLRSLPLLEI